MFSNRIVELESSNNSGDLKGHSDTDLATAKALKLIIGEGSLEGSV